MWRIEEHRRVDKRIAGAPREILKRYENGKTSLQSLGLLAFA